MVQVAQESVPSYMFQPIDLPAKASPDQLISALSKRNDVYWTGRKITTYKILKVRAAKSGPSDYNHYTAVLLDTNAGQEIVLLKPMTPHKWIGWYWYQKILHPMTPKPKWLGWYYKIYDVTKSERVMKGPVPEK